MIGIVWVPWMRIQCSLPARALGPVDHIDIEIDDDRVDMGETFERVVEDEEDAVFDTFGNGEDAGARRHGILMHPGRVGERR